MIRLPVRFTADDITQHQDSVLRLEREDRALLLVDCDGDCGPGQNRVIDERIAPVVRAARSAGLLCVHLFLDISRPYPAINDELHHGRRASPRQLHAEFSPGWRPIIAPTDADLVIGKTGQDAFATSSLGDELGARAIHTILLAGFSFKSCLFHTAFGGFNNGYRAVVQRDGIDPPGENEWPDSRDHSLAEGGWVRRVLLRQIEDHLGYTATCADAAAALEAS